jgi:hypothetical protein
MTDHARDDRARKIDTVALRARLSAVAHGSDRPYAAAVAKDEFGALSILLDEIDRLRAEVERLQAGNGLRPIETAPRDGTQIDLWAMKARWANAYWSARRNSWVIWGMDEYGFLGEVRVDGQPTHWMPLPEPPKE